MEFIFENNPKQNVANSTIGGSDPFNSRATYVDSPRRTRKTFPASVDDIEISRPASRQVRKKPTSKLTYVKSARKTKRKEFEWSWNKVGWMVCGVLFLRLILMDNGVLDYYDMEKTLDKNHYQLELIREENADLVTEIHEIKTNPRYQKKLAREHLGVIAQNEYLVLFAKDS